MEVLLDELSKIDFGYPLGTNAIRSVARPDTVADVLTAAGECAVKWLVPLYSACDGLSFPDVHVGYFIKPLQRVISFDRSSEPDTLLLDREIAVLPVGSTGGGGLFVVRCEDGCVLLLPPGPMKNGRYEGTKAKVKEVAKTVPEFLELLLADLRAFVNDDRQHAYIA